MSWEPGWLKTAFWQLLSLLARGVGGFLFDSSGRSSVARQNQKEKLQLLAFSIVDKARRAIEDCKNGLRPGREVASEEDAWWCTCASAKRLIEILKVEEEVMICKRAFCNREIVKPTFAAYYFLLFLWYVISVRDTLFVCGCS